MSVLLQDVRCVVRLLLKQPGLTAIIVLSLALGIGANTMIFTLVNGFLIRPLPYPNSDRMVFLWFAPPNNPRGNAGATPKNCQALRERTTMFEDVGCFWQYAANVGGDGPGEAAPERLNGQWMTVDLAKVMAVKPNNRPVVYT